MHLPGATSNTFWEPQHHSESLKELPSMISKEPNYFIRAPKSVPGVYSLDQPHRTMEETRFNVRGHTRLFPGYQNPPWSTLEFSAEATKEILWDCKHLPVSPSTH